MKEEKECNSKKIFKNLYFIYFLCKNKIKIKFCLRKEIKFVKRTRFKSKRRK